MANRKRNVSYVQQEEPAFLKRFKERVGYKDGPTLETKNQQMPKFDDDDRSDTEEDAPTVVVLRDGDLTAEEAEVATNTSQTDAQGESGGRILFKKPSKGSSDTKSDLKISSKKQESDSSKKKDSEKKEKKKQISNTKLLSFGDDEEED